MIPLISILGVDGAGKSTLMNELAKHQSDIGTLKSPQFYESFLSSHLKIHPILELSVFLEEKSKQCDTESNAHWKAVILFLQFSLFGKMEQLYRKLYPNIKILFRERDPYVDFMAYAPFYAQLLNSKELTDSLHLFSNLFFLDQIKSITSLDEITPNSLRKFILKATHSILGSSENEGIKYSESTFSEKIIFLKIDEPLLIKRLKLKSQHQNKEAHEEIPQLLFIQNRALEISKKLSEKKLTQLHIIEITENNQSDILNKTLNLL